MPLMVQCFLRIVIENLPIGSYILYLVNVGATSSNGFPFNVNLLRSIQFWVEIKWVVSKKKTFFNRDFKNIVMSGWPSWISDQQLKYKLYKGNVMQVSFKLKLHHICGF